MGSARGRNILPEGGRGGAGSGRVRPQLTRSISWGLNKGGLSGMLWRSGMMLAEGQLSKEV